MKVTQSIITVLITLFLSLSVHAENQHGDWETLSFGQINIAKTTTIKGIVLGVACPINNANGCIPYVVTNLTCAEGGDYPMLLNILNQGVYNITTKCEVIDGVHVFALPVELLENMKTAARTSLGYGFGDGTIGTADFSLNGYNNAFKEVTTIKK